MENKSKDVQVKSLMICGKFNEQGTFEWPCFLAAELLTIYWYFVKHVAKQKLLRELPTQISKQSISRKIIFYHHFPGMPLGNLYLHPFKVCTF